jgi:hypothetical protein
MWRCRVIWCAAKCWDKKQIVPVVGQSDAGEQETKTKRDAVIKTFEEARAFVLEVKVCTLFANSGKQAYPSLWDNVDLPDKRSGEGGWGERVSAIWTWKNRLPERYPDEIFYGKVRGGHAVLMEMGYLRDPHFATAYRPAQELSSLAQFLYDKVRFEPWDTAELRRFAVDEFGASKGQFDTALKNLQISLNIARANDPSAERDTWLAFSEAYHEIWAAHVG